MKTRAMELTVLISGLCNSWYFSFFFFFFFVICYLNRQGNCFVFVIRENILQKKTVGNLGRAGVHFR